MGLLNQMRRGEFTTASAEILKDRVIPQGPFQSSLDALFPPPNLYCKNIDVESENAANLKKLPGRETVLSADERITGTDTTDDVLYFQRLSALESRMPYEIFLKPLAQVGVRDKTKRLKPTFASMHCLPASPALRPALCICR